MKSFTAITALVGAAAATAVTSKISPTASAPSGCATDYAGSFEISVVNVSTTSTKRSVQKRKDLTITLSGSVLTDDEGRTGYIASNYQFQFDGPVQAGAIYTAGWSVCSNGTLALGGSAVFYECLSGTFYNLYDESTGAQCTPIYIDVIPVSDSTSSSVAASQVTDGQVQATTSTAAVTQITDGQVQATTSTAAVSQISDGQIQATTATAAAVSQISDGQIQATTSTAAAVSQISDGQIQATTGATTLAKSTGTAVSQISDGQIQAATNASTIAVASLTSSATASAHTGGASIPTLGAQLFGLAAGAVAVALF